MGMLVLASASPRRAELLTAAGFRFSVSPQDVDEARRLSEGPEDYVLRLACEKARSARQGSGAVVIGADTAVVVDGDVLGKPRDDEDAARMLRQLSGRSHQVLTGLAVGGEELLTELARTSVWFVPLADHEIAWYVASGEPRDKAGGYAIQGLGSRFVSRIDGSYSNVVGLPVSAVYRLLRRLGVMPG